MSVQAQKYVPISSKIYRRKVIAVTLTTSLTTTAVTSECQNFDSDSPIFLLFDFDSFMNGIFLQLWTLPPDTYTYSQKCTPLRVCYFPTTHIYKRSISTYLDPIYKQNCFPTGSLLPWPLVCRKGQWKYEHYELPRIPPSPVECWDRRWTRRGPVGDFRNNYHWPKYFPYPSSSLLSSSHAAVACPQTSPAGLMLVWTQSAGVLCVIEHVQLR